MTERMEASRKTRNSPSPRVSARVGEAQHAEAHERIEAGVPLGIAPCGGYPYRAATRSFRGFHFFLSAPLMRLSSALWPAALLLTAALGGCAADNLQDLTDAPVDAPCDSTGVATHTSPPPEQPPAKEWNRSLVEEIKKKTFSTHWRIRYTHHPKAGVYR